MEPEGLLPCLQVPATCLCPEPDQSSACPQSHFQNINLNMFLPFMPWSSKLSLSLMFSHQNLVYNSALLHTCYMPHPSKSSQFDSMNNIFWEVQYDNQCMLGAFWTANVSLVYFVFIWSIVGKILRICNLSIRYQMSWCLCWWTQFQ
jgi:hypothetical protein